MLAVKHGKADLVELLLGNGAAVNVQDIDGSTALIFAVEHGSLNIVKLLLTRAECDVNIANRVGMEIFCEIDSWTCLFQMGQTAISIANNKNRKNILVALYAKMKERKAYQPVRIFWRSRAKHFNRICMPSEHLALYLFVQP